MDIQNLTPFFKWCTIINGVLLTISVIMFILAPDFIYGFHGKMFSLSREAFDVAYYALLGLYKILWLIFNVVPWVALLMIAKK